MIGSTKARPVDAPVESLFQIVARGRRATDVRRWALAPAASSRERHVFLEGVKESVLEL